MVLEEGQWVKVNQISSQEIKVSAREVEASEGARDQGKSHQGLGKHHCVQKTQIAKQFQSSLSERSMKPSNYIEI